MSPCALKLFTKYSRATASGELTAAGGSATAVVVESGTAGSVSVATGSDITGSTSVVTGSDVMGSASVVTCSDAGIADVSVGEGNVVTVVLGEEGAVLFFFGLRFEVEVDVFAAVVVTVVSSLEADDVSETSSTVVVDVAVLSVVVLKTGDGA